MRAMRRVSTDAAKAVKDVREKGLLDMEALQEILEIEERLRGLNFTTDEVMEERLRQAMADFVSQQCMLLARMPSQPDLDITSRSFVKAEMHDVNVIFVIAVLLRGLMQIIPSIGAKGKLVERQPSRPKVSARADASEHGGTSDGLQVTSTSTDSEGKAALASAYGAEAKVTPTSTVAKVLDLDPALKVTASHANETSTLGCDARLDEENQAPPTAEVDSTVNASQDAISPLASLRPKLSIRAAAPDLNAFKLAAEEDEDKPLIDSDPEQSAANTTWKPHEGAVVRTDGFVLPYYSGAGVRRLDPPAGSGPIRLSQGYRWLRSAQDGLWRDETLAERRERGAQLEASYYSAFENPLAPKVNNPIPRGSFGCVGPGQDLPALLELARVLLFSSPYQAFAFEPDSADATQVVARAPRDFVAIEVAALEPRNYLDVLDRCVPTNLMVTKPFLRLKAESDKDYAEDWQNAPSIVGKAPSVPGGMPVDREAYDVQNEDDASLDNPPYAPAARKVKLLSRQLLDTTRDTTGLDKSEADVLRGYTFVFSGPAGSGKTHLLVSIVDMLFKRQKALNDFFFINLRPGSEATIAKIFEHSRDTRARFYQLNNLQLMGKVSNNLSEGRKKVLFVDEYSELSSQDLAMLAPFHQIILFGDYAQDNCWHQPVFDFVKRCGGGSRVLTKVWRARSSQLFDVTSLLAYDGVYRSVVGPNSLSGFEGPSTIKTIFCPDDAQAEVFALWCAAHKNPDYHKIIVVDGAEAQAAVKELRKSGSSTSDISIASSDSLRGHETGIILFASAALDRAGLSTTALLERLIVIFGRAKWQVEIVLPKSDAVGSSARRCTCLLQPLLSYRLAPREPEETEHRDLSRATARHGFTLGYVDDMLIAYRPSSRCLVIAEGHPDDRHAIALQYGWKKYHTTIDPALFELSEDELLKDQRFLDFMDRLKAIE